MESDSPELGSKLRPGRVWVAGWFEPKPGLANPPDLGWLKPPLEGWLNPPLDGWLNPPVGLLPPIPGNGLVTLLAAPLLNGLIKLPFGLTAAAGFFYSSSALFLASSHSLICCSSFNTPGVLAGNFLAGGSTGLSGLLSSVILSSKSHLFCDGS